MNDRFMGISRETAEFYAFKEEVREVGVRVNWWVRYSHGCASRRMLESE